MCNALQIQLYSHDERRFLITRSCAQSILKRRTNDKREISNLVLTPSVFTVTHSQKQLTCFPKTAFAIQLYQIFPEAHPEINVLECSSWYSLKLAQSYPFEGEK